jgi:hypothetical protein
VHPIKSVAKIVRHFCVMSGTPLRQAAGLSLGSQPHPVKAGRWSKFALRVPSFGIRWKIVTELQSEQNLYVCPESRLFLTTDIRAEAFGHL